MLVARSWPSKRERAFYCDKYVIVANAFTAPLLSGKARCDRSHNCAIA
jgi:hypothetical protein